MLVLQRVEALFSLLFDVTTIKRQRNRATLQGSPGDAGNRTPYLAVNKEDAAQRPGQVHPFPVSLRAALQNPTRREEKSVQPASLSVSFSLYLSLSIQFVKDLVCAGPLKIIIN